MEANGSNQSRRLQSLLELTRSIDVSELWKQSIIAGAKAGKELLALDDCKVWIVQATSRRLELVFSTHGFSGLSIPLDEGPLWKVITTGSPIQIRDIRSEPRYLSINNLVESTSALLMPAASRDRVYGTFCLERKGHELFTENEKDFANSIILQMSVAYDHEIRFKQINAGYFSVFIAYSATDESFARRLYTDLEANGVDVSFAPEHLKIGDYIKPAIEENIEFYDKLLLVLSGNSINSAWVRHEFTRAVEKERKHNKLVLFPIRLDNSVFETTEQWAFDIRQRHIGDFRNWTNPLLYQNAMNRLLRDLNANPNIE